jgi:hypothetical protein
MSRDICVNDVPRHHITLAVTNYAEIANDGTAEGVATVHW